MNNPVQTPEQIDPSLLILDRRFQGRQTNLIYDESCQAAVEISRQQQIQDVLTSLENGNNIHTPLEACELFGELYVVDGFHRTEACHKFLKANKGINLQVPVLIHRGFTEADIYLMSLTMNRSHGTALSPSERWQNQFKRHLMQGEHIQVGSKRALAKEYDSKESQGLHIQRALNACIEAGLPSSNEWAKNYGKAVTKLKKALIAAYNDLEVFNFDKDNFPIIRPLADASTGRKEFPVEQSEEDLRKQKITDATHALEEIIVKHGGDCFREALKRLDRQELGLTIKKEWNKSAVTLKYNPDAYDEF
jgi:hypothetical protein